MHFRARSYFPAIGRFMQRDPKGTYTANYRYGANNPLRFTDPMGKQPDEILGPESTGGNTKTELPAITNPNYNILQITAFIPSRWISGPEFWEDFIYKGDKIQGNTFQKLRDSFRVRQRIYISNEGKLLDKSVDKGMTKRYKKSVLKGSPKQIPKGAKVQARGFTKPDASVKKLKSLPKDNVLNFDLALEIQMEASNPLVDSLGFEENPNIEGIPNPANPKIEWTLYIGIENKGGYFLSGIEFDHKKYPAYDIFWNNNLIYSYDPRNYDYDVMDLFYYFENPFEYHYQKFPERSGGSDQHE